MNVSAELIAKCRAGNRLAQKELYLLLLPYLRAVCQRYLFQSNLLQDALQESFVLIFKNMQQYDPSKGDFKHWAVRVTINATLNHNRKFRKQQDIDQLEEAHELAQEAEVYTKISDEDLLELLKQMPKQFYEVFNLYAIDGYSHEEIGSMLEIKPSLSRQRLSRARTWLKNTFAEPNSKTLPS